MDAWGKKLPIRDNGYWAPYVCVRVIGSVAPASRKQLIPTSGKRGSGVCTRSTQQTTQQRRLR